MTRTDRIIRAALFATLAAVMLLPILCAPVMRANHVDRTMSATAYFGER